MVATNTTTHDLVAPPLILSILQPSQNHISASSSLDIITSIIDALATIFTYHPPNTRSCSNLNPNMAECKMLVN